MISYSNKKTLNRSNSRKSNSDNSGEDGYFLPSLTITRVDRSKGSDSAVKADRRVREQSVDQLSPVGIQRATLKRFQMEFLGSSPADARASRASGESDSSKQNRASVGTRGSNKGNPSAKGVAPGLDSPLAQGRSPMDRAVDTAGGTRRRRSRQEGNERGILRGFQPKLAPLQSRFKADPFEITPVMLMQQQQQQQQQQQSHQQPQPLTQPQQNSLLSPIRQYQATSLAAMAGTVTGFFSRLQSREPSLATLTLDPISRPEAKTASSAAAAGKINSLPDPFTSQSAGGETKFKPELKPIPSSVTNGAILRAPASSNPSVDTAIPPLNTDNHQHHHHHLQGTKVAPGVITGGGMGAGLSTAHQVHHDSGSNGSSDGSHGRGRLDGMAAAGGGGQEVKQNHLPPLQPHPALHMSPRAQESALPVLHSSSTKQQTSAAGEAVAPRRDVRSANGVASTGDPSSQEDASRSPRSRLVTARRDSAEIVSPSGRLLSPAVVNAALVAQLRSFLTSLEQEEILSYTDIYFVGTMESKEQPKASAEAKQFNSGYDDSSGRYLCAKTGDQIFFRYRIDTELGSGSFGSVYKCFDLKSQQTVAIKVIKNSKRFTKQAEVELKILHLLNADSDACTRSHCIFLLKSFSFRGHTCFVFPLYGLNLFDYLKVNGFRGCSMKFVHRIAVQLLEHLVFLKEKNVVHCDLKPENILIQDEKTAKIVVIDFGSSCMVDNTSFTYVQSRFYRAPEVLLGLKYGVAVDMWSLTCILPEMRCAEPIFPGCDECDQMATITEVLGLPPDTLMERSSRREKYFTSSGRLRAIKAKYRTEPGSTDKLSCRQPNTRSYSSLFRARNCESDQLFASFLEYCLKWDPLERPSPSDAMQHPWITSESK